MNRTGAGSEKARKLESAIASNIVSDGMNEIELDMLPKKMIR